MKHTHDNNADPAALNHLIAQIIVDADSEDDQFRAFHRAFLDTIQLPCDAFVIGEPVSIIACEYDGQPRRGLTIRCRRGDGSEHTIAAADMAFAERSIGHQLLAAYRHWLGLEDNPKEVSGPKRPPRQHKASTTDIDPSRPVELVVLSLKETAARCRLLDRDRQITLRASGLWETVPGEIIVVRPSKVWTYAGNPYLSGDIESVRLDVGALGLVPLKLTPRGLWDPAEHNWGAEDEPPELWAQPIVARGPREEFEMQQVVPGEDPQDFDSDPILRFNALRDAGHGAEALQILMECCQEDLRCLDAHAHLGLSMFERPQQAIRHYEAGVRIGELSLGPDFDGLLPWHCIDNRPLLRCLQGYGLCLWRLQRFEEAARVFDRLLWLNPTDNQGIRFLVDDVRSQLRWEDCRQES